MKKQLAVFEAQKSKQANTVLYVGIANAKDLINVSTVDYYNPKLAPTDRKQGYQRPPERSRITKIGNFLLGQNGSVVFPTAVLLAARKSLEFDKKGSQVILYDDDILQIVDGQHRLFGLKYAIEEKGAVHLENYPIPFVIMETADKLEEMSNFRIVNGTAKSVRTDLVNMILTATYANTKRPDVPKKDQWRIVVSNVIDRLSKDSSSVWYDTIILPGEQISRKGSVNSKIIPATSFITSLRPVYIWLKETIMDTTCNSLEEETEYMLKVVSEYWHALRKVVPDAFSSPSDYVIQKTPGLFSLHRLLKYILVNMYRGRRDFDKKNFIDFLKDHPEVTDSEFWKTGNRRAEIYGSMKGFEELYENLKEFYKP